MAGGAPSRRHLIQSHPADLIVTVHPFANTFALKALNAERAPFITVVTDMVTTHALWFDRHADLILVPTESARERAIHYHMDPGEGTGGGSSGGRPVLPASGGPAAASGKARLALG